MEHAEILKNCAAREEPRAAHLYLRSIVPPNYIPTQFMIIIFSPERVECENSSYLVGPAAMEEIHG